MTKTGKEYRSWVTRKERCTVAITDYHRAAAAALPSRHCALTAMPIFCHRSIDDDNGPLIVQRGAQQPQLLRYFLTRQSAFLHVDTSERSSNRKC